MPEESLPVAGPVLLRGVVADAILLALREHNAKVDVLDRGGYIRASVPGRCVMAAESVSHWLGREFRLPGDLEKVMPSFEGRMTIDDGRVVWTAWQESAQRAEGGEECH